ncbi:adenylyl-sulfate kinase [Thiohalophilus thiocyanatoxydans]|uniref:Adenylyl-sulfate kinase n=1 Tax=Thiohalophilus thiocyanatoxydans TaxID=381308 RepID=A0A4R8IZ42_9GAMM|nr:adenylyl-sulfate kinase [Thiohalophilus thiocyanatoxydans]TDY02723.1 adenylylsulfate kinase [Thiohalophilus thiocyanatoxydans]
MTAQDNNVVWHAASIDREQRESLHHHKSAVLWFTGLSASGKSTLAHAVEKELYARGCHSFVLDGDNVRHGLCSDLSFSLEDRHENIRRIGNVAKLFIEAGVIVLTAFISPLRQDRNIARNLMPHGDFLEIFCDAPVEVCEKRDPKGLYQKARDGKIPEFTGISSPYEAPLKPELHLDTGEQPLEESVQAVINLLTERHIIKC